MEHKEGNIYKWKIEPIDISLDSFKILSETIDFLYGWEESKEIRTESRILIFGTFFGYSANTSGEISFPVERIISISENTFYAVCKRYDVEYFFEFNMKSMSAGQKYIEHLMTCGRS